MSAKSRPDRRRASRASTQKARTRARPAARRAHGAGFLNILIVALLVVLALMIVVFLLVVLQLIG